MLSEPDAKSVECLTIKVHFARERPNPAKAPYLQKNWKKNIGIQKRAEKVRKYLLIYANYLSRYNIITLNLEATDFFAGMEP